MGVSLVYENHRLIGDKLKHGVLFFPSLKQQRQKLYVA